jgi:hypothetical protein
LSIPKNEACKELGHIAYSWIQSWFWYVETLTEFEVSLQSFWTWLDTTDDVQEEFSVPKLKIRDFVTKSLLPKREYWLRCYRLSQLSFDAKTTSVVEGQNSALKDGTVKAASNFSLQKATEVSNASWREVSMLRLLLF